MRTLIKNFTALAAMVLISSAAICSNPFQGTIKFTKTIGPVTASYIYYVKGDKVRVEELGENGELQGIMIVDIKENTVTALSPERKMFIDVPNKRPARESVVKVIKTENRKTINGFECREVRVSGVSEGREIIYWVAEDNFDFFIPLLETLNRKDKLAVYFMSIPDIEGVFPIVGTEKKKDGIELSKLQVTEMKRGDLNASLFQIPEDYKKFERE